MCWDLLPEGVLALIIQRVATADMSDLYQCLAVSTSWRSSAKQVWRRDAATATPWLLIDEGYHDVEKQSFLIRVPSKHSKMISTRLPTITNSEPLVRSSYKGWLLLVCTNDDYCISGMYLYNPLTRMLIELPEPPLRFQQLEYCQIEKFFFTSTGPTDPNCIVFLVISEESRSYFLHCKISKSWDTLGSFKCVESVVYYQDKLLYVDFDDDNDDDDPFISHTSFSTLSRLKLRTICLNSVELLDLSCILTYYVESKMGELLVILRFKHPQSYKTYLFHVYKVNWSNNECESVGEFTRDAQHKAQALFLARLPRKESIFASVDGDDQVFKPNCIYFYDKYAGTDSYGLFDLEKRAIEQCEPSSEIEDDSDIIVDWFRPSAL